MSIINSQAASWTRALDVGGPERTNILSDAHLNGGFRNRQLQQINMKDGLCCCPSILSVLFMSHCLFSGNMAALASAQVTLGTAQDSLALSPQTDPGWSGPLPQFLSVAV